MLEREAKKNQNERETEEQEWEEMYTEWEKRPFIQWFVCGVERERTKKKSQENTKAATAVAA